MQRLPLRPRHRAITVIGGNFVRPNGLAFSLDERQIYIVDTRRNHIRRFTTTPTGLTDGDVVFAESTAGCFDGIRLDDAGRIWAAAGDGVHCIDPDGTLLGKLRLPEEVSNITFGGPRRNQLFVTATTSLYSIRLNVDGAPDWPTTSN